MTLVVLLWLTFLANVSNWGEEEKRSVYQFTTVHHVFFTLSTWHLYASLFLNCPLKVTSEFLVKPNHFLAPAFFQNGTTFLDMTPLVSTV